MSFDTISDGLHAREECFGILEQSPIVASAREKDEQLQRLRSYADGVEDATKRELLEDAYETIQRLPKTMRKLPQLNDGSAMRGPWSFSRRSRR